MPVYLTPDVRAVFFDAANTLLHTREPVWATYRRFALKHGADIPESAIRERIHREWAVQEKQDAGNGWKTDESREYRRWKEIVERALAELPDISACFAEMYAFYATPQAWMLPPGVAELLNELTRRGLICGIASNFDERLRQVVSGIEELRPIEERLIISSTVGHRKPSPIFFAQVTACAGLPPEQILFVGDDPDNDIAGAAQAGMRTILFDSRRKFPDRPAIAALTEILG